MFILYEVWWYGWFWLAFVAIAFFSARFLGGGCLLSGLLIAIILFILDVNWIFDDMRNHPENERDADFVFIIGVLMRVMVFNLLLLPVTFFGQRLFKRQQASKGVIPPR